MTLPIDPLLPQVISALRQHRTVVLEAPPGAGKTTRVPLALLEASGFDKKILVLQPRRLAARLAARFIAQQLEEPLGQTVGYRVRFEKVVGPKTRLEIVTEALLLRRMLSDPLLLDVGVVVFDEVHERHLATDIGLALVRRLQCGLRPDLRAVVMSATLDAAPLGDYLGDCVCLRSEGRVYPVDIAYQNHSGVRSMNESSARTLTNDVVTALAQLLRDGLDGHVLVFLPGAREIRFAEQACQSLALANQLALVSLHGGLPPEQQDLAIRPSPRRKVILSTNVAETSITIDGIAAVIDSGLARVASHDPWAGLPTLLVKKVSRASATQRAGRAGRVRAGRCLRLYSQHDHDTRRAFDTPEILRLDLCETVLLLAALDVANANAIHWLESPPQAGLDAAGALLSQLGAIAEDGSITAMGRRMAKLPVHPRQARIIVEAESRGLARSGCSVAALLGERSLRRHRQVDASGDSDLIAERDLLDLADGLVDRSLEAHGIDVGAARRARRARDQLLGLCMNRRDTAVDDDALRMAILTGYPDRVGRRRFSDGRDVVLCGGGSAQLAESSVVRQAEWLVAVSAEAREKHKGLPRVEIASAIEPDWLLDLFPDAVESVEQLIWNEKSERVESHSGLHYGTLVLDQSRGSPTDGVATSALLREKALAVGVQTFAKPGELERLFVRLELLRGHFPELPKLGREQADEVLAELCEGQQSFADIRAMGLVPVLMTRLGSHGARLLDVGTPAHVCLPSGRRLAVHYEVGRPPWVESYLQDFFGMADGPRIVEGRLPLTLHLLAPNRRAVQVTVDLQSFWRNHYPELRRSLSRRYPRHDWPEDPAMAKPPTTGARKGRQP